MSLITFLFGRPLASDEDSHQRIGATAGIPIFGLDALGSAAYGPEAALTLLIPLGLMADRVILPISLAIIALLIIVYFSYRQTIDAYPSGGGSYTVASRNLGARAGLLAAAALAIDYVLVVAVGISAGVGALVSALPNLQPYTLVLCMVILAFISVVNLRGVRETGAVFLIPTTMFSLCLFITIGWGIWKAIHSGGHPAPIAPVHHVRQATESVSVWLLLRAFSSGCTAITGVEAVSNGVMAFREPRSQTAKRTLTAIIVLLMLFLAGIAYLCRVYSIGATHPGRAGYESVLSQMIGAVAGRGWFYYASIFSIVLALSFQANTAFAGFPRLCRAVAQDGYLPHSFADRGRCLVYTQGIYVLIFLSAVIIFVFGGITDRLIPLFAVGAFLAFTLSQAGMVVHWKREGGRLARQSMAINAIGAAVTAVTVIVIIFSKFMEGAWVTLLLIPILLTLMYAVRRHYDRLEREMIGSEHLSLDSICPPYVIVPIEGWSRITERGLRFALTLSTDVEAVHIHAEGDTNEHLAEDWPRLVDAPAENAGYIPPRLTVLHSPYRYVITPLFEYVLEVEKRNPDRQIAVIVPTLVEPRWYHNLLHSQRAELLTAMLLFKGNRRIIVINVPWYL